MNKSYLINPLTELPFHNIGNDEFFKGNGAWVYSLASTILDSKDLFQDVKESSEKTLESETWYTMRKLHWVKIPHYKTNWSILRQGSSQKRVAIFHCNMCSLAKNLTLLNDITVTFKKAPDIIAISEVELNDNYLSNISILGYSFLKYYFKNFCRRCWSLFSRSIELH